jgi:hypothetical protein
MTEGTTRARVTRLTSEYEKERKKKRGRDINAQIAKMKAAMQRKFAGGSSSSSKKAEVESMGE